MKYSVPFYSNTPDDMRCVPAVFRMVLKYFFPEKEYSWEEMDQLLGHIDDKGTWFFPALLKMKDMGVEIEYWDLFNYERFLKEGEGYLLERQKGDQEKADWYKNNSDIFDKIELIPEFVSSGIQKSRLGEIKDIEDFLVKGYLVACDINVAVLDGDEEYLPHYVLVTGFDKDNFTINDPGLPPQENRVVSKEQFWQAWSFDGDARSLTAFKYEKH